MTQLQDPSEFLTGDFAHQNNVTSLILLEEGKYEDKEFTNKDGKKEKKTLFTVKVQCNDPNNSIKLWSPNNTSIKKLKTLCDGDTKNIIGVPLKIIHSFQQGKWIVYIDPDFQISTQAKL